MSATVTPPFCSRSTCECSRASLTARHTRFRERYPLDLTLIRAAWCVACPVHRPLPLTTLTLCTGHSLVQPDPPKRNFCTCSQLLRLPSLAQAQSARPRVLVSLRSPALCSWARRLPSPTTACARRTPPLLPSPSSLPSMTLFAPLFGDTSRRTRILYDGQSRHDFLFCRVLGPPLEGRSGSSPLQRSPPFLSVSLCCLAMARTVLHIRSAPVSMRGLGEGMRAFRSDSASCCRVLAPNVVFLSCFPDERKGAM